MNSEYHEQETVTLNAKQPLSRAELHEFLCARKFVSEDDFYFLRREDQPEPWQAESLMSIDVLLGGSSVYETEEDIAEGDSLWDELKVSYLMATLPKNNIPVFSRECEAIANKFSLDSRLNGESLSLDKLEDSLNQIAGELAESWSEAGSKTLAILVEESYS